MAPIVVAIAVSTAAGVSAEHRYGGRAARASRRGLMIVLYVVLPPVTFLNLVGADLDADHGIGIALALVTFAALGAAAWFLGAKVLHLTRPQTGALICSQLVVNTGYLGYAVVAALLGLGALSEAVAYDILVSSPALLLGAFAVGAAFGAKAGEGPRERVVAFFTRNPPLYAAALALVAPASLAPEALVDFSRWVVVAVLPLGFFAVGAALAEDAEEGKVGFPPAFDAPVAVAVGLRLLIGPALLYALSAPFIEIPDTYLLLSAMPCGLNTMIVAHAYGLDLRIAAGAIAWSTALGVAGLIALTAIA